jgi:hypothetical protein
MALLQKAYLGATPLFRDIAWYEDGAINIVDISAFVTVTANSTAHTKGSWAQIIASTSQDASLLYINVDSINTSATNTATLVDIATGASGSETAILSNVAVGSAAGVVGSSGLVIATPFKIPSGTRISARIQSVVSGGKTGRVQVITINAGDYATAPTSVDCIGGDTATSQGVSFSGGSGTWVEGVASTSRAYKAVCLIVSCHTDDAENLLVRTYEVGVGAASSEVSFGSARFNITNGEQAGLVTPYACTFGRNIPAGSRLAVKHPIASNSSRYGFTLIGIP